MCCVGAPLCAAAAAADGAADGADDLLVMTDNGTHPVQIHTRLPCLPHFLTHSHAHFRQKAFIQHALRKLKCICCKKKQTDATSARHQLELIEEKKWHVVRREKR